LELHYLISIFPSLSQPEHGLPTGANQFGQQALQEAGLSIQVLDPDLLSGINYLVGTHVSRPVPNFASAPSTYPVALSATNGCGTAQASKDITVLQRLWEIFLPLLHKE